MKFQYKYKFYINASHYVMINGNKGDIHSHCFELVVELLSHNPAEDKEARTNVLSFTQVENVIEEALSKYQNVLLNDVDPFGQIFPTVENLCMEFKNVIETVLWGEPWKILSVELSETPTRSYIIVCDTDID